VIVGTDPLLRDPKGEVQIIPDEHEQTGAGEFPNISKAFLTKVFDFPQSTPI
jgi:hypothetical protein